MKTLSNVLAGILLMAACTAPAMVPSAPVPLATVQANAAADDVVGTWVRNGPTDGRATRNRTVLELRADGTYTKTMDSVVDGNHYGGSHSGTWSLRGTTVFLSGDGNWPASSYDLRTLNKVE